MPQTIPSNAAAAPKLLHIFKPGKWTAMSGESIEFSAADLAATAKAFDPSVSKAPIVIGHPATDDPAKGWISALVANERGLFAQASQIDPAFAEAARAGRYGTLSAKFYRPTDTNNPVPGVWYLRHLGALGAAAPGVKGLDSPGFAAGDEGVCFQEGLAFSEWDDVDNANLWRNLREWFIGKFGQAEADTVIPSYTVKSLEQGAQDDVRDAAATDINATPAPQFSESHPPETTVTPEQKTALEAENTRLRTELAATRATQLHAAHVAFCDGLPGVMPAWRDVVVATLDHLAAQPGVVEFGEGEARAPLADKFKAMLTALPAAVQFGEHATGQRAAGNSASGADADDVQFSESDPDRLAQHKAIRAHMTEHKVSYQVAAAAVIK
ncbi:MAG: peptidase [Rhodoferax sp.]